LQIRLDPVPGPKVMESLVFSVKQITAEGISGHRSLAASWFSLPPGADDPVRPIVLGEPVEVDFHLSPFGRDIRVELSVNTVAILSCSRCLSPFPFRVSIRGKFTLCRISPEVPGREELELTLEDLDSGYFEGEEIDLSGLVHEQIVLSFPMKPLCREECKGLCPRCGADQNTESCQCGESGPDPRWEPLLKLRG
jgi:uncharacterized protein